MQFPKIRLDTPTPESETAACAALNAVPPPSKTTSTLNVDGLEYVISGGETDMEGEVAKTSREETRKSTNTEKIHI